MREGKERERERGKARGKGERGERREGRGERTYYL